MILAAAHIASPDIDQFPGWLYLAILIIIAAAAACVHETPTPFKRGRHSGAEAAQQPVQRYGPPWMPAPRPASPPPPTGPMARLREDTRASEQRISDLMRQPPAPRPYMHDSYGTAVYPLSEGQLLRDVEKYWGLG